MTWRCWRRLRTVAVLAALTRSPIAAQPADDALWFSIAAEGGARLGYGSRELRRSGDGAEIVESSVLLIQELNSAPVRISSRTVLRQDDRGRTVAIDEQVRTGRNWARTEARIDGDRAEIARETAAERRTIRLALPAGVRFDGGAGLLPGWDPATTPRLEFDNFNLGAMTVERVVIEPAPGAAPGPDGRLAALRLRYEGSELRGVARLLLDADRRIVAVTQPMFGTSMTIRATDRESALRPHPAYSVLPNALVRSPFRIPPSALNGQVRYRVAFSQGIAFPLPQTSEQRVTPGADGATLDVCADCGPGLPRDAAALADALRPTVWLQSDHARIRAIATPVARRRTSDRRKMELLLERARPYLARIDFTGHYSALETLSRRAGDCTEAAVLLAALGRAAGIPTRVANGLVYSRARYHGVSNVFMPHSWTLAHVDGEWRSFDLALDAFDSSHIALTIGDGDARSVQAASQLAALLRWEAMTEVRNRPAG